MRIRKFTAITFLSLASIIMLAFTVFPHHHHQEFICFTAEHCQQETHHSHDDNPLSGKHNCVSNLLQTQVSRLQDLDHHCKEGHCHHFIFLLFMVTDRMICLSQQACRKIQTPAFYKEKLHDACYVSLLNGRAPPATMNIRTA